LWEILIRLSYSYGFQYASEEDAFVASTFSIFGNQFVGTETDSIAPVFWTLANINSGEILTQWNAVSFPNGNILPGSSQAFGISVKNAGQVKRILKNLKNLAIIFSFKSAS
jgi:hypothetical protein